MATIYKYPIEPETTLRMPVGAKILAVQAQYDEPQIWALVDPDAPMEKRKFSIFGTGQTIPDGLHLTYIGTFQLHGGSLVFHLFEHTSSK